MTHSSAKSGRSSPWLTELGIVTLVVAFGMLPRLWAARASLWVDELHTSWTVVDGWSAVAERARAGNQSPLYFYLQWLLLEFAPHNELTLRLLSLLAGAGLLAGLVILARRWTHSSSVALLVGLAAALDENLVFYASEARPYALVQLVALVHIVLTAGRTASTTFPRRFAWTVLTALLFHLHYTTVLLIAAAVLILAAAALRALLTHHDARPLRALGIDLLLVAVLVLPALPHMLEVAERRAAWSSFVTPQPIREILSLLHAARYLAAGLLAVALSRWFKSDSKLSSRSSGPITGRLLFLWFLPVTLAWFATTVDLAPLFHSRYLIAVAVVPLLLMARGWTTTRVGVRSALGVLLLIGILVSDGYAHWFLRGRAPSFLRREDWRGLASALGERTDTQQPLIVRSGLIEAERIAEADSPALRAYCLFPLGGLYRLTNPPPEQEAVANEPPFGITPSLRRAVLERGGAWVVWRGHPRRRAELVRALCRELASDPRIELCVEQSQAWGSLRLLHLRVREQPGEQHE